MPSARQIDVNGYMEIKGNPLTKEGVYDYTMREVGAGDSDEIVQVYRPAAEIIAAAESFRLMPLVDDHTWLGQDGMPPEKKGVLGTIGEEVYFDAPYLRGNIRIFADHAKRIIDAGKIELSAGYRCRYEPEAGSFEGRPYQYIQRDLRANHIALVDRGRTGADVSVLDHFIFTVDAVNFPRGEAMNFEAILGAVAGLSEEEKKKLLAAISGASKLPAPPAPPVDDGNGGNDGNGGTGDDEKPEIAAEANEAAEKLVEAAGENDPTKTVAQVAEAVEELEKVKEALGMDTILKTIAARDMLAKSLVPHIGAFDYGHLTKEQVAAYGLKKLGIKVKGDAVSACDAALQIRTADAQKKTIDSAPKKIDVRKFWR